MIHFLKVLFIMQIHQIKMEIITSLKTVFYENYYKHFLLSNLPKVNDLYIPLSGSEHDACDTTHVNNRIHVEDIQAKIISSISTTAEKSYVVFGDGGTGKTTLALSIVHEFWKQFDIEKPVLVPIYINLPQLQRSRECNQRNNDVLGIFLSLHFCSNLKNVSPTTTDIWHDLTKNYELLLVLDEYDGYVAKRNLWEHNGFTEHNIKTITFSRPEVLSDLEFDKTFSYKFEGTQCKAKYFFLLPFASIQISSYLLKVVDFLRNLDPSTCESPDNSIQFHEPWLLTKEITKLNQIWERDSSEYRHWFQLILPELGEVSQTPFLLCLLVQVLPTIVEEYRLKPNQSSFDMQLIQLVSTEVGIYDQFTRRWFDYSTKKIVQIHSRLKEIENCLPQLLEIYSNNLAHRLFNRKQGFVGDGKIPRKLTEEWDLWKPNENCRQETNLLEELENFSHLFPQSENNNTAEKLGHLIALRSGCLLRYFHFQPQGENYMFQFLHSSLLEYFVSRTIFKGLRGELNFHLKHIGVKSTDFAFSFESIRTAKYVGILHKLVERARTDFDFKTLLISVVYSSKEISSLGVMSSNAFTILTQAYRVWCDEDFSYVNITDADMSHCIFVNCKFKGADMSRALLTGTFFYQSHLQAANLYNSHISRGLNFHLQENVQRMDRKIVKQFQVIESEGNDKVQIVYRNIYGRGISDLQLFNVKKRKTKVIVGSPKWCVVECRKFYQNVLLVALQSGDNKSGQTLFIYDPNNRPALNYLDQVELSDQRDMLQSQAKNLSVSLDDDDGDSNAEAEILEIFTVSIPNYDEKVVCYRIVTDEVETPIIASSFFFSLTTTSSQPFCFTIQTDQKITKSFFSLSSTDACTFLAASSDDFVTLFNLQKGTVLFRKKLSPPEHKGQLIVTFIRFSPDGKYLLFDMGQTLVVVSLLDNFSLKEVSLLGSKGWYDSMLSCDFSSINRHLIALVYDHGTPLIIDLTTGDKLQSIKIWNKCESLSFIGGGGDKPLQLVCASNYGSLSSHKIQSIHTGDPRSIQALNPRTDFHSLIDRNLELVNIFVSTKGKYMAVVKQPKHQFFKTAQDIYTERIFCILLFKIDDNTGKRTYIFNYTFSSPTIKDVQVAFINETFLCLIYPKEFKVFKCERPHLRDDNCNDPVAVKVCFGQEDDDMRFNFEKSWYNEPLQQIIVQRNDSFILELYSIKISTNNSSISFNVPPLFRLDLQKECSCPVAKIFFHVNESDSFAYIFPFGQWICVIWNLKSGEALILSTTELEPSFNWDEIQNVSTIFVDNGLPLGLFIDFSIGSSGSFQGVVDEANKALELKRIGERNVYQMIESTNYFMSYCRNSFFTFGIQPSLPLFPFNPIHDVLGFQLMPVTITDSADCIKCVRLLVWNVQSISCIEVNLTAMELWKGEKHKFTGWRLVWCDPPNDQFSLLLSNTTNAVLGRDEDWDSLSKRFGCVGKVSRCLHSYISLSTLFEQIHDHPYSIFSEKKDLLLSNDVWILLVIAKKNGLSASRLVNINVLQAHSGIIIEGIRHGKHFAFRADLFINSDKNYEITLAPLKRKKEKYFKLHKRYLATEFMITSEQGYSIIDKILADKQSEIDYHLLYKNCNSWVKSLLSLIGVDVDRKWSFVDLSNDFFRTKETKSVVNLPVVTVTGLMS